MPIVLDFGSGAIRVGGDDTSASSLAVARRNGKRPIDALSTETADQDVVLKRARPLSIGCMFLLTSLFRSTRMFVAC